MTGRVSDSTINIHLTLSLSSRASLHNSFSVSLANFCLYGNKN